MPPLHEVRIEPLTPGAFVPHGGAAGALAVAALTPDRAYPRIDDIRAFLLDGSCGYVLHVGTWSSLDRHPLAPPATTHPMISDHETQADLVASCAGHGRWTLTQEIDLERECGAAVELMP
jgi:hypothetical protein